MTLGLLGWWRFRSGDGRQFWKSAALSKGSCRRWHGIEGAQALPKTLSPSQTRNPTQANVRLARVNANNAASVRERIEECAFVFVLVIGRAFPSHILSIVHADSSQARQPPNS